MSGSRASKTKNVPRALSDSLATDARRTEGDSRGCTRESWANRTLEAYFEGHLPAIEDVLSIATDGAEFQCRACRRSRAAEVGGSPVYLTQVFRQVEERLYRYYLRLRLARALGQITQYDDLSALAADLGCACHSYFTAVSAPILRALLRLKSRQMTVCPSGVGRPPSSAER